ncbi:hypothetical protein DelCs14_1660 [Delftia sp. Cs1-4]|nr:hypothetical protein DelCs14_1660 [Delftia sp. Cs1-4]
MAARRFPHLAGRRRHVLWKGRRGRARRRTPLCAQAAAPRAGLRARPPPRREAARGAVEQGRSKARGFGGGRWAGGARRARAGWHRPRGRSNPHAASRSRAWHDDRHACERASAARSSSGATESHSPPLKSPCRCSARRRACAGVGPASVPAAPACPGAKRSGQSRPCPGHRPWACAPHGGFPPRSHRLARGRRAPACRGCDRRSL